ncbi:hypothetical protein FACS1894142_0850 [Spirochaetia bacterium]|nr:hypothetical protein FACS1894142_0850 [Spirochaetia bacterium]
MSHTKRAPFLCCLLFIQSLLLFARDVEISVRDADVAVALEGAILRSWDGSEQTAGEDGACILSLPDDRPVSITIAYPGYENLRLLVPLNEDHVIAELRMAGVMESRELVIEGERAGLEGSATGRAVAIGGEALARTAETGLFEDVMTSIGLLPGVGYTGFFDAMPSIRGGEPRDMTAALDGFYIENPYHWDGAYSIFDPRMTGSARLSHGVFSSRFGNTISGLLEVTPKRPSADDLAMDISLSTSAVDLGLSVPLNGKGGVMIMGKVTWWQPFIELAHLFMPISRNVKQAPWIASGAVSADYRFTPNLEWTLNGFISGDGIGFSYITDVDEDAMKGTSSMSHFFDHELGFLNTGLTVNPLNTMVLRTSLGAGFNQTNVHIDMKDSLSVRASPGIAAYDIDQDESHQRTDRTVHFQGRADFDWDLGRGFLVAAGAHEQVSRWSFNQHDYEPFITRQPVNGVYISRPLDFTAELKNNGYASSAYTLLEYGSPNQVFGAELGLRGDHIYLEGEDFSVQTRPVLNPRLNLDFGILKNQGPLDSLNLTLGTGLFSSVDETLHYLEKQHGVADFAMKPTRSWTSLAGTSLDFSHGPLGLQGFLLSVEGYYKYVFDRTYTSMKITPAGASLAYNFDGEGQIWGIDLLLQKTGGRYWDGWLSYSFNHARYRDPLAAVSERTIIGSETVGTDWYYPAFHRFHTLNLVLNIKPLPQFHIATRLGFTSGKPKKELGPIEPVTVQRENGDIIEQFIRTETYSDSGRTAFSMPLDIKFSWYRFDPTGRVRTEIYFSVENILSPLLPSAKTTIVNPYTGIEETAGGMAVMTQLAMPLPSFGIKWSY